MPQFLPEHKTLDTQIPAQQQAQITFQVPNPGPIDMTSRARIAGVLAGPAPQRIELFKPNSANPVLSKTSTNGAQSLKATFDVTAADAGLDGNWAVKVTNLAPLTEKARLEVAFPGTLAVQVSNFPVSAIETLVDTVLKQVQVHITRGANQSFISFPDGLNIPDKKFTIDDVRIGPIVEHPNDINSNAITLDLVDASGGAPKGALRLTVKFEGNDREIKGTLGVEMNNMQLAVTLGLAMLSTAIVYDSVDVDFSANINVIGIPDNLVDGIVHYKDTIKRRVEAAVKEVLTDFLTCQKLSRSLTSVVNTLTGPNSFLADVRVAGGQLEVTFFRAA
jgi:hypothetical protein